MPIVIQEGLEIDSEDIPARSGIIVRLGPLNVPVELKEIIEGIAEDEFRSLSSVARMLIEYGLLYLDWKQKLRARAAEDQTA